MMSKTQLAEKRYRSKKNKKEIRLYAGNHKKRNKKVEQIREDYEKFDHSLQKTKSHQIHKRKSNMN